MKILEFFGFVEIYSAPAGYLKYWFAFPVSVPPIGLNKICMTQFKFLIGAWREVESRIAGDAFFQVKWRSITENNEVGLQFNEGRKRSNGFPKYI